LDKGADNGTIYALSRYYWQNKKIRLRIYCIDESKDRKAIERELLSVHVKLFGALPICQGTTGSNYTTTFIENLDIKSCFQSVLDCSV
jgi:hypothetical protein